MRKNNKLDLEIKALVQNVDLSVPGDCLNRIYGQINDIDPLEQIVQKENKYNILKMAFAGSLFLILGVFIYLSLLQIEEKSIQNKSKILPEEHMALFKEEIKIQTLMIENRPAREYVFKKKNRLIVWAQKKNTQIKKSML